jgi:hypothetical protein
LLFAAGEKKEWYSGGTLHKKTGTSWVEAPAEDRLATAADFATVKKPKSMTELKVKASELTVCINKALERPKNMSARKWQGILNRPVAEIAAACGILLGW